MAPKRSPASLTTKRKETMSKTEQKMALVAKRLSMLQDDAHDHDSTIIPVSEDILRQSKSESTQVMKENLKSISDDSQQRISSFSQNGSCKRIKLKRETFKDTLNHGNIYETSENPKDLKMGTERVEKPDELSTCMERATKIQASLSGTYPSFIKQMLPSHVSGGFWLHLTSKFCEVNLPKENCPVVLVDETGREFKTIYLAHKKGLSGGWKAFSVHHKLLKGDVLVFHLIHPTTFKILFDKDGSVILGSMGTSNGQTRMQSAFCSAFLSVKETVLGLSFEDYGALTFRVYIAREHRLNEVDGALGILGLDTCSGQMISGDTFQKVFHTEENPPTDPSTPINSDIDLYPEVLDGIYFSDTDIKFEAINNFDNFNIVVDNLVIDSQFSIVNRQKYYELCLSQNSFLHQQLLKGLNCNLVVGIILETINIADAIKACTSLTSVEDLETWKTTLNGFELFGMKVNFLCTKLDKLLGCAAEINSYDASNWSEKCTVERVRASDRMRTLEIKLEELKGVMEKIDSEIDDEMTASVQKHKAKVEDIARSPW